MGMNVGGADPHSAKSEINVTPLVDVVLVLLIIFLVTMPIMMMQISIEIPRKINQKDQFLDPGIAEKQITLVMGADGRVKMRVGASEQVGLSVLDLPRKLKPAIEKQTGEKVVFVDFDYEVKYANVMTMMDLAIGAGADKVALIDKSTRSNQ